MNGKATDTENPVVARTRQAREALARQCAYDLVVPEKGTCGLAG